MAAILLRPQSVKALLIFSVTETWDVITWRWPQDRPIYLYPPSKCKQIKLCIPDATSI